MVDAGEDDDKGAEREVLEEIGLTVSLQRCGTLKIDTPRSRVFANLYICRIDNLTPEKLTLQASEVEFVEFWSTEEILAKCKDPESEKVTPDSALAFESLVAKGLIE